MASQRNNSLAESKEKWDALLDPVVELQVLNDIIARVKEGGWDGETLEQEISFESFGVTYTFKDLSALQQSITVPQRFVGKTNNRIETAIDALSKENIFDLYTSENLAPTNEKIDLSIFTLSLKSIFQNNRNSYNIPSPARQHYGRITTGLDGSPELSLIGVNNTDFAVLNAPRFVKFLQPFSASTGFSPATYDKNVVIHGFIEVIRKIIESNIESDPLLQAKFEELYPVVIAKVLKDVQAEEASRDLLNALVGGTDKFGSVVKELTAPPAKSLTPFDFQCFLLENIAELAAKRRSGGSFQTSYKHLIKIDSNGNPAEVLNTIQHGGQSKIVEELLNICPEVYAFLVPYIKISRIEYDELGDVLLNKNGTPVEKELAIPNFLDQTDINNITSGEGGRAAGGGIKSFTWSLDGVQPAEVYNNISANLTMYFQSVNDFFNGANQAGADQPSYLDLIINSPAARNPETATGARPGNKESKCDILARTKHRKYEGNNYRIKVCAGWATPDNLSNVMLGATDTKIKNVEAAIERSKISLYLQQTRHNLSFNEDGSVELSIDYQASLAGLLTGKTSDIFAPSAINLEQDIDALNKKIEGLDPEIDSDSEKIKSSLEEIKELRAQDRLIKYKKFLKVLFGDKTPDGAIEAVYEVPKIYNIAISGGELILPNYRDLTPKQRAARAKRRINEQLQFIPVGEQQFALLDSVGAAASDPNKDPAAAYSGAEMARFDDVLQNPGGMVNVPFFFLGDLLDSALEQIKINNKGKDLNFKLFVSDVEMIDPLVAFQLKNLEDVIECGDLKELDFLSQLIKYDPAAFGSLSGITQTMNIGDIPISIDAFQLWFKDYVVKREVDKYYFLYFVKDVCKELITNALKSKCFGGFGFDQRFDVQPITLDKKKNDPIYTSNKTVKVGELAKRKSSLKCTTPANEIILGLILLPTDSRPRDLQGLYGPDLARGIYHHYLGSSCSLVKKINFTREEQEYLRESRIQKFGALGPEQLRELYSANINLIGNTLYRNGMYIYINPSLMSARKKDLEYLGLHGYYLVTSVKSTITVDSFNTDITALHEGIEFKDNTLITPEVLNVSAERAPNWPTGPEVERLLTATELHDKGLPSPTNAGPLPTTQYTRGGL
jgi:hypothetical protein